jgi:hypothetical protein
VSEGGLFHRRPARYSLGGTKTRVQYQRYSSAPSQTFLSAISTFLEVATSSWHRSDARGPRRRYRCSQKAPLGVGAVRAEPSSFERADQYFGEIKRNPRRHISALRRAEHRSKPYQCWPKGWSANWYTLRRATSCHDEPPKYRSCDFVWARFGQGMVAGGPVVDRFACSTGQVQEGNVRPTPLVLVAVVEPTAGTQGSSCPERAVAAGGLWLVYLGRERLAPHSRSGRPSGWPRTRGSGSTAARCRSRYPRKM